MWYLPVSQRHHGSKQPVLRASPEWTIFRTILVNFVEFHFYALG
jgi:hypothetical protein